MIIVIFLVCVAVILLGAWLREGFDCEVAGNITMACGILGSIVSFIALIALLVTVSGLTAIQPKIEMYQTENTNIENFYEYTGLGYKVKYTYYNESNKKVGKRRCKCAEQKDSA